MRCLYCGKELALLKRLTGGGDFCSDAHKQGYQEEYNRLALGRLLQAQKKGLPANNSSPDPPPKVSVALPEPAPQGEMRASQPSDLEVALAGSTTRTEARREAAANLAGVEESSGMQESPGKARVNAETAGAQAKSGAPDPAQREPLAIAGFLFENPALAALPDQSPYVQPWLEPSSGPAVAEWQLQQNDALSLCSADLLTLDFRPDPPSPPGIEDRSLAAELSASKFPPAQADSALSGLAKAGKIGHVHRLPAGDALAIDLAPSSWAAVAELRFLQATDFENGPLLEESRILELSLTDLDFPPADADVVVSPGSPAAGPAQSETEPRASAPDPPESSEEGNSPRSSLAALSRLRQQLADRETQQAEEAPASSQAWSSPRPTGIAAVPVEVVRVLPVRLVNPLDEIEESERNEPETGKILEAESRPAVEAQSPAPESSQVRGTIQPAGSEKPPESDKPTFSSELVEFAIKTFPSIKPAIIGGDALPSQTAPLLPYLKGLPLRPKIALASGYVPPSQGPGALRGNPVAVGGAPGLAPSKLAPGNTQATRVPLPKTPAPSANLPQRASGKDSDPRTQGALAPASTPDGATKQPAQVDTPQAISGAQQTKPEVPKPQPAASVAALVETSLAQPGASGLALKAPLSPVTTATAGDSASPATEPDPNAATEPNAAAEPDKDDAAKKDTVPSFSAAQPANIPWLGSLKLKLGLAIALVVIACVYFLGWGGGRAGKPGGLNSGVSADSSGPSIILGEGGWVEDWGGDPTGVHAGRQITIYRPSLKLSDYRLEFQGNIDAKSLGWVFRAADPDNYYAMKLMIVSSGLSTKVALFKYLVANGKQIQVGRVPIDLAVLPDTVFNVRVDVRGPQFTTYVQGRQVDTWTDDQLKTGGTGFLNEREERGKVKSVSIRYLSGTAN